jgi:outer membrane receptor protein involved in Fe transport
VARSDRQLAGNVTHFRQGLWGGDHEFKLGVELHRDWYNKFQELRGPGTGGTGNDYLLTFFNGEPQEILLRNTPFNSRNNVDRQFVFLRDNWQASDRLTVNLGLRFERSLGYLPAQSKEAGPFSEAASFPYMEVWDWKIVTPRTGISYALTADKRTVVKATWGRFGFFVGPNEGGAILRPFNQNDYAAWRYRWLDVNGNRDFELGEQGELLSVDGSKGTVYNPVRQPKAEETTVFVEREVTSTFSAKVGYVYKRLFDQYRLVNEGRPFSAYDIALSAIDPGPDGAVGNGDDGGPVTYYDYNPAFRGAGFERNTYRNLSDDVDSFHNMEFAVNRRLADRWQLSLSYLATREISRRTALTPNDQFVSTDVWHNTFKALGTYRTFWDIYAGARFEYLSGEPRARDALFRTGLRQLSTVTLRLEPLGAQRMPALKLLSIRAAKRFKVRGDDDIELQLDVHNALNESTSQTTSFRSGPTFGQISSILPPRVARLGISYRF